MALQTSGVISLGDVASEFGGSQPHALSEYYGAASGVPASGAIALSGFYGASSSFALTITSDQENLDLRSYALSQGWDGASAVSITIDSGVVIYSAIGYALTISGAFPGGLTLTNLGHIVGGGGNGATGGYSSNGFTVDQSGQVPGTAGQPGILVEAPAIVDNQGVIAGGGGGGGAGGGTYYYGVKRGGGGGGGRSGLTASIGNAYQGANGSFTVPGSGGPARNFHPTYNCGAGGAGGSWGANGQSGTSGTVVFGETAPVPASGGGAAVVGNSNITWVATGARYGAIQ